MRIGPQPPTDRLRRASVAWISATPTSTSSRDGGGNPTVASQARPAWVPSAPGGVGSPWWNSTAWMRCVHPVRWSIRVLRPRTSSRRSSRCAGGIHDSGSRAAPAAPAGGGHRSGRSWRHACGPQRGGVGRLGEMGGQPGRLELLGHKPPAGAALHREVAIASWQLAQPLSQHLAGGRGDLPRRASPVSRSTQS
jgi:hypothetical protein